MSQTILGTYKNGTISLDRLPEGVTEARVVVGFVDEPSTRRIRGAIKFGMFTNSDRPFTSDEDLEAVKKSWNRQDPE
jgi:hypothetical protein